MINLKSMYKNIKYGILVKIFLFLALTFLSVGTYFCFAPKNEVRADDDQEYSFKIDFKREDDGAPDLFAGSINIDYVISEAQTIENPDLALNDDGSYTFKIKKSEIGNDTSGYFKFKFVKDSSCDLYDHIGSVEGNGTKIDDETVRLNDGWADDEAVREFTIKFAYSSNMKYTKAKISGSGRGAFMNGVSTESGIFRAYDYGGAGDNVNYSIKSFNRDKGIIIWESKELASGQYYRAYDFMYVGNNIFCKSRSCYQGNFAISFNWDTYGFDGRFSSGDVNKIKASNLFFINLEYNSDFEITLQTDPSGEDYMGEIINNYILAQQLVPSGYGDYIFDNQYIENIEENTKSVSLNTKMFDTVGYKKISFPVQEGVTISNVTGPNVGNQYYDDYGRYVFEIHGRPGDSGTYTIFTDTKKCDITLQGPKDESGSTIENQKLGTLANKAELFVNGNKRTEMSINENDEDAAFPQFKVASDFGEHDTDTITIKLTACVGMKIVGVYNGEEIIADESGWNDNEKTYTFTIKGYPGETVAYTIVGEFLEYPLTFKGLNDSGYIIDDNRFNVYKEGEDPQSGSKQININLKTPTNVVIDLDGKYSQSNISLEGYGKFAGNGNVDYKVQFNNGDEVIEAPVTYIPISHYNYYYIYLGDDQYLYSDIEYVYSFKINDVDHYLVKIKRNDKIYVFQIMDRQDMNNTYFRDEITTYENTQVFPYLYKGDYIEYSKEAREGGKIVYNFNLLNPDFNPEEDYFVVMNITVNHYDVTVKCDESLSEIANDLHLKYNGHTYDFTESSLVIEDVSAEAESTAFEITSTLGKELAQSYVTWFSEVESSKAVNSNDVEIINKEGSKITLGVIPHDCEILLNAPPLINTKINFEVETKYSDLLKVYKAGYNSSTEDYTKGSSLDWNNYTGKKKIIDDIQTSHLKDMKFYYWITTPDNEFISEEENKNTLKNLNLEKITQGGNYQINKITSGSDGEPYQEESTGKYYILVEVLILKGNVPSDGFSIKMSHIDYPARKARFISEQDMALFMPISGWINLESPSSFNKISEEESEGPFEFNTDLAFKVEPSTNYEIYNIEENLVITTEAGNSVDIYNSQEYTNDEGKSCYEITLSDVKSNIKVEAKFDPLHKTINFNNVEGLIYYEATNEGPSTNKAHGKYTVKTGDNFYFAVKAEQGYNLETATISGGIEQIGQGSDYKLYRIKESGSDKEGIYSDHTISGSIVKLKYNVNFEGYNDSETSGVPGAQKPVTYKKDGAEIPGNKLEVEYGDNVSFTVEISPKYNKSNFKIKEYNTDSEGNIAPGDEGTEINLVGGKYSVVNITSHKVIKVEGIAVNSYNINLVKSDAIMFLYKTETGFEEKSGVQSVKYDESAIFKVEARTGYAITDEMKVFSISESGVRTEIKPGSDGTYSISGIKEDYEIRIEDVENIMFKVELTLTDGVTYLNEGGAVISGTSKVKYGNNFEFSVAIDDAYDDSIAGMYIIVNDGKSRNLSAQKLATGRYIISNITEDVVIKVGNIRKNSYTVTLTKVEGMDYYNSSKKVINGDNSVNHGDSLSFKVGLHSAYDGSGVKVMLGNEELKPNDSGFYTVPKVIENKTVTVLGVEENEESKVVNTINNLPSNVSNLTDVDAVIAATKDYEKLSDDQKQKVSNIDVLRRLQEQVKEFHHVSNDVRISGVDWRIKLIAVPISFDKEACTRIYKKLNSEYIISLYDVYLWDTINDVKYTLPEGQEATITLPKPDLTYFEKPTGIHEKDGGKISFLTLSIGSETVRFTTDSFSPMGIIANRSSTPGRSSLLDAADANVGLIRDYALSTFGSGNSGDKGDSYSDININDGSDSTNLDGTTGNINEKFKSRNNPVTAQGSAVRLALVLMLLILLAIIIIIIIESIKRRKKEKNN